MTLVIEDGSTSLASANSYMSISSCSTYLNSKGITTWAAATTGKEVSLIQACLYMELLPWKGLRSLSTDPLAWPRLGMLDRDGYNIYSDVVPLDIKRAQCELAYRFFLGRNPMEDVAPGDQFITREHVGPIDLTYSQSHTTNYKFIEIDLLLGPYLNSSLSVPIERA